MSSEPPDWIPVGPEPFAPANGTEEQALHPVLVPIWNFVTNQHVIAIMGGVIGFWGGVFGSGLLFLILVAYRRWRKACQEETSTPGGGEEPVQGESDSQAKTASEKSNPSSAPNDVARAAPARPVRPKISNLTMPYHAHSKQQNIQTRAKPEGVSNKKKAQHSKQTKPIPSITHTVH